MLFGSDLELGIPLVAVATVAIWIAAPRLRRNESLRAAMILSVAVTGIEVAMAVFLYGAFILSGGMQNF